MLEEHIQSLLSVPLDTAEAGSWRARAEGLLADWPRACHQLPEPILNEQECLIALEAVRAALTAAARAAGALPGYGPTHLERMLTWALGIAGADKLSRSDAARLFLAGAYSDLGRVPVPRDTEELRHAEASAVIFDEVMPEIDLPAAILVPVRYAIAAHTVDRFDYDTATYRVADDVRTIDKLDMLGGAGLIRCVAHYALDESISFLPYGGEASSPTVLWPWWRITKNLYPIEYSAYARDNACDAVGWGEEIMNDELTHEQPYHDILALLFDLINEIENLVADNCYERLDARMGELGADDYHRWGEILEGTATRIEDEEHGRSRSRVLARRTGDPLLSGMADLLEMGPGGWGTEAIRAQAAQVYQDAEARDE